MTTLLDIDTVSKRYGGVQALSAVSFRVERGRIKGLIGPNGAGKTSLFNCVCGVLRVDSGHIRYAGRDLHGLAPHRRRDAADRRLGAGHRPRTGLAHRRVVALGGARHRDRPATVHRLAVM